MRAVYSDFVEACRVTTGHMATQPTWPFGLFLLDRPPMRRPIRAMVSDGGDWAAMGYDPPAWEHVSVSLADRCPTWEEMEWVRTLFWDEEETVLQLHVPRSRWVNCHRFCLHLWKPVGIDIPLPPPELVAPTGQAGPRLTLVRESGGGETK
jgi:hypothetical protein